MEPWAARAAGAGRHCSDERWRLIWNQREHLLKVARRRSMSLEDAEDAVHEAMLRAMEQPHLDAQRLPAWLTTVTMRLCVDRYRQVNREAEVGNRATLAAPTAAPVEELVCDRDEASWVARRSGELPGRQAEALWLKSEEMDVGQVARRMGLSYRTVESLLARARRTLRNSLAGTLAVGLWLFGRGRPRTGDGGMQSAAVVSTVATLTVLGIAVPGVYDSTGPGQQPQRVASPAGPSAGDGDDASGGRNGPWPGHGMAMGSGPGVADGPSALLPGALTALPSLPPLRVGTSHGVAADLPPLASLLGLVAEPSATSVPPLPAGGVGTGDSLRTEEPPSAPAAPSMPPATPPVTEGVPGVPGPADDLGGTGPVDEMPGETAGNDPSSDAVSPEAPPAPDAPDGYDTPDAPGTPTTPGLPGVTGP